MKSDNFKVELEYITDERLRNNAKIILEHLPDYFYEVQAASTGKYHPSYALGNKGLIRHTKAAVCIAYNLFNIYKFEEQKKDIIIISILIHDGLKHGFTYEKYSKFEHPLLIKELLNNIKGELSLTDAEIKEISDNVSSHMGKYNTNNYSDIILPLPVTVTQKFIHMCDYLASRKQIHFDFNEFNDILE